MGRVRGFGTAIRRSSHAAITWSLRAENGDGPANRIAKYPWASGDGIVTEPTERSPVESAGSRLVH